MQSIAGATSEELLGADELRASQYDWRAPPFDHIKFAARQRHNLEGCLHQCAAHPDTVLCDFIGLLYDSKQLIREATTAFEQALQLDSTNHIARSNLERLLRQKGQPSASSHVPDQSSDASRRVGLAWWSRAFYHMRMHHGRDAVRCFERAHALLPEEPKLIFYLATQLNRRGHKTDHQRALELLQSRHLQSVSRLEVLSQLVRAAGGALPKREAHLFIQAHLREARVIFKQQLREGVRAQHILKSYSSVLVSAADVYRDRKQNSEALRLFEEAIQSAGNHAGTHAFHNRAVVRRTMGDIAGAKSDLHQALSLEPDSYAAAIDLVKLHMDGAGQAQCQEALDLCVRTLCRADCNPGMLNRIQLLDLQMQLLSTMSRPIPSHLLDALTPLITAFEISARPAPTCSAGRLLTRVKESVASRWSSLFEPSGPIRSIRLIDVHLQLRNFEQAEAMLCATQVGTQVGDDHRFQRARSSFLRAFAQGRYEQSADEQIAVARLLLHHAAAGDLFDRQARRWPGDDSSIIRPAIAVHFPSFRSALATTVLLSVPSDVSAHLSEPKYLTRSLQALQLLCAPIASPSPIAGAAAAAAAAATPTATDHRAPFPSDDSSSSSSSQMPGHVSRTRELCLRAHELFCCLFDDDPMWHRLDVPDSVMIPAARVLLGLAATKYAEIQREMLQAAIYHACGTWASSARSAESASLLTLLARQLCCGTTPDVNRFQDAAEKLVQLRALHLRLHMSQLQLTGAWPTTSSVSALADARAAAVELVNTARTLLDYFISAFKVDLSSLSQTSAPSKDRPRHLNFPRVPVDKRGPTEDELQKYLRSTLRLDFRAHLPATFSVLLHVQPHRDPVQNAWLEQLYLVRNTDKHMHSVAARGVSAVGSNQPIDEIQLAHTAMQQLPRLLRDFKHACDADLHQVLASSSSPGSPSRQTHTHTRTGWRILSDTDTPADEQTPVRGD